MQKRLLEIPETKSMFIGDTICSIALMQPTCFMTSIGLKIIAYTLCGWFSLIHFKSVF